MLKSLLKNIGLALVVLFVVQAIAVASNATTEPKTPAEATFKSRCDNAEAMQFPPCASSPSECGSKEFRVGGAFLGKDVQRTPFNCIFLQEPIGGKPSYDLYKLTPVPSGNVYELWKGEAIVGNESGPFQALLTYEVGKEFQGPFGLLYNYLGLVYNFLSGIIIAFVVLVTIVGGIRMTTSGGDETAYKAGRDMIIKALVGMVLWFTASVILYTINPTFLAF